MGSSSYSPTVSVILIDISRRWKSLRLELHKARFYMIWSEDALNVTLIKGWWHKSGIEDLHGRGHRVLKRAPEGAADRSRRRYERNG